MINLPGVVVEFVRALNAHDASALLQTFAGDARVNDQLQTHRGRPALREWVDRDIIADQLTLQVVAVEHHYDNWIITAHADGNFDKRGLPEPLVLTLYFSLAQLHIVQLIILRETP